MADINSLIEDLKQPENSPLLYGILRGLEKESLRVDTGGGIAKTRHPKELGSALTHSQITTDFSESLLEFITPPSHQVGSVIENLMATHQFTHGALNGEHLWPASMPCLLDKDEDIPVALYGNSNVGRMKTIYRQGLGHRYGRKMQTISGIHYNFSLPSPFWAYLHGREKTSLDLQQFRTERYFDLIRNFRRYYWILLYLFGASPAVCGCFVEGKDHNLDKWDQKGETFYRPYATSLRMGDLGYQSDAQSSLLVDYNDLGSYLRTLCRAINTPYKDYTDLGVQNGAGDYQQLNASLLQIENEFYSAIRPKRTARTGETALTALFYRGVEYIEVRCVDLNPYEPLGISRNQMLFLDTFLLYCLLEPSPQTFEKEFRAIQENQKRTVYEGRDPNLKLIANGSEKPLRQWGQQLLESMRPVAELLDISCGNQGYMAALESQCALIENPELTPSAKILQAMKDNNQSFFEHVMSLAQSHSKYFKTVGIDESSYKRLQDMAEDSLLEQAKIEVKDKLSFEDYLQDYYAQYDFCARA
ncbi:glutamate--cysteine ligase [Sessilibacter corallicola]|uniref:Glutamate--cysteine ligase n=1 Tax=Sessilibacter corallicola TaxID=2904075 RepID=A0ABQ0ABP5_9GAMM